MLTVYFQMQVGEEKNNLWGLSNKFHIWRIEIAGALRPPKEAKHLFSPSLLFSLAMAVISLHNISLSSPFLSFPSPSPCTFWDHRTQMVPSLFARPWGNCFCYTHLSVAVLRNMPEVQCWDMFNFDIISFPVNFSFVSANFYP